MQLCMIFIHVHNLFRGVVAQFGEHVARVMFVILIFNTGMFISATGIGQILEIHLISLCLIINFINFLFEFINWEKIQMIIILLSHYKYVFYVWYHLLFSSISSKQFCNVHLHACIWRMVLSKWCSKLLAGFLPWFCEVVIGMVISCILYFIIFIIMVSQVCIVFVWVFFIDQVAILGIALGSLIGWPFCALLG